MELQSFKRPGSYGKEDAVQRLVSDWASSRGMINVTAPFAVFGPKGAKATFAFVESGPRLRERISIATRATRLPFHIVSADAFDGKWAWRRLATGTVGTGTRQDFQRYVCKLTGVPSDLKGSIALTMREQLLSERRTWTDLAIREIGHVGTTNKVDVDSMVVDKNFERGVLLVEGQHVHKELPWRITRNCALEMGAKSCCIQYNDLGEFAIETKPNAGFGSWLSANEMKNELNRIF